MPLVVVTRPKDRGDDLAQRLRDLGLDVIEAPTVRLEPPEPGGALDDAVRKAADGAFSWVVFTSVAGVEAYAGRADALGVAPPRARIAAVGDATAEALRARGMEPRLVPREFTTEALGRAFPPGRGQVLLARADAADPGLEDAIETGGWTPVRVDAYRTVLEEDLPEPARRALDGGIVDLVTFTSASTVEGFLRLGGDARPPAVAIGPVTAAAARRGGFEVVAVADPHTVEGLVEAVRSALRSV